MLPQIPERYVPQCRSRLNFKYPMHATYRKLIFERDNFECQYCSDRAKIVPETYTGRYTLSTKNGYDLIIDHIRPLRFGGSNDPQNLQVLCGACNNWKITAEEWRYENEMD